MDYRGYRLQGLLAVVGNESAMCQVHRIGTEDVWVGQVKELCEAANKEVGPSEGVQIANFLCNGNYAISGGVPGCEAVERLAKSFKARKTIRLAVAGAFHTHYMQPAEERLRYDASCAGLCSTCWRVMSDDLRGPSSKPSLFQCCCPCTCGITSVKPSLFTAAGCLCNPFDVRRVVCSPLNTSVVVHASMLLDMLLSSLRHTFCTSRSPTKMDWG